MYSGKSLFSQNVEDPVSSTPTIQEWTWVRTQLYLKFWQAWLSSVCYRKVILVLMLLCFYLIDNRKHLRWTRKDHHLFCLKVHNFRKDKSYIQSNTILWVYKMISVQEWSRQRTHNSFCAKDSSKWWEQSAGGQLLWVHRWIGSAESKEGYKAKCSQFSMHCVQNSMEVEEVQRHNNLHPSFDLSVLVPFHI